MENILNLNLNDQQNSLNSIFNILNVPIIINSGNNILNRSFEDQGGANHPTEKNFVKNLKEIVFKEDQKEISCGICLDTFKKDDKAIILPCKKNSHYFHYGENKEICEGILPWLKDNNTCPVCRDIFPEEDNIKQSENEHVSESDIEQFLESITSFENIDENGEEIIEENNIVENVEENNIVENVEENVEENNVENIVESIVESIVQNVERNNTGNNTEDTEEVNNENLSEEDLINLITNTFLQRRNISRTFIPRPNIPRPNIPRPNIPRPNIQFFMNMPTDDSDDLDLQEAIQRSLTDK